jgi:hypothetical protein
MLRFRGFFLFLFLACTAMAFAQQYTAPRMSHAFSPHRSATARVAAGLPDTVRLLAVMVEFQEDDDSRTSGNGTFGTIYEYDYGTEILDPMPHDRTYFQQHLLFLENYVRKVSGRKTILKGTVLDGIVTLDKPLSDYSFRKDESEAPVAQLAVDAWSAAGKQFSDTRFGDYDMFVVFHAGRGRDVDLVSVQGFDPTPLDIPSLAFTMESFKRLLGENFTGIAMPDGSTIADCAIIPTTNNREIPLIDGSYGLLELTINGLLAASFGTWAGLPDLFDTETGKTGIGRFGLMDGEGIFAYGGICPPEPSAWEKQLLGWTIPREAMPGNNNYLLTASDSLTTPDVLRIPITGNEYWLVENRQRDLGGNGQSVTFVSGGQTQTLRFPKDTTGFQNGDVSQLKGVIVDVEDIDWALPGGRVIADDKEARINGGLLIWHIDEQIINEYLASNTVNTGEHTKGVDLEQAGGPQDIGVDIQTVFGTQTGTGSPLDYWTRDNVSPVYTNSFGMFTAPNTRANSGAFTHVTMSGFSASGPIMSLDVALGDNTIAPMQGWPVDLSDDMSPGRQVSVQTADLDGDSVHEIIAVYSSSTRMSGAINEVLPDTVSVYVFRQDGSPYLPQGPLAFRETGMRFASSPVIGDWNDDGMSDIAIVTRFLEVYSPTILRVLSARDTDSDGRLDVQQRFDFAGRDHAIMAMPALVGDALLFRVGGAIADTMYVMGLTTRRHIIPRTEWPVAFVDDLQETRRIVAMDELTALLTGDPEPMLFDVAGGGLTAPDLASKGFSSEATGALWTVAAAGDYDGDGAVEAVLGGERFLSVVSQPADAKQAELRTTEFGGSTLGALEHAAVGDVDGDGRLDMLLSGASGLRAMNFSLSTSDYYPAPYPVRYALSAALEESGGHAIFGVGTDRVWQFTTGARQADGFPVPLPHNAEVALFPSGTQRLSIAAASPDGKIFLFETGNTVTAEQLIWRSRNGDEKNAFSVTRPFYASSPIEEFFPEERCYNWPNPVYDDVTHIRVYVSMDANVTINIYDLAGDKVDEISASAVGGTDTDIAWNVKDIQSDVYLARVQVSAGASSGEKIIKIAIVK